MSRLRFVIPTESGASKEESGVGSVSATGRKQIPQAAFAAFGMTRDISNLNGRRNRLTDLTRDGYSRVEGDPACDVAPETRESISVCNKK